MKCHYMLSELNLKVEEIPDIFQTVKERAGYLQHLLEGRSELKRMRILVVGNSNVGKTTFIKCFIGKLNWHGSCWNYKSSEADEQEEVCMIVSFTFQQKYNSLFPFFSSSSNRGMNMLQMELTSTTTF